MLLGSRFYDGKVDVYALAVCWLEYLFPGPEERPRFLDVESENHTTLVSAISTVLESAQRCLVVY